MKKITFVLTIFLVIFLAENFSYAENIDMFGDYYKSIRGKADAKVVNVYSVWGDNMANLIERGSRDGIVIKGEGDYAGGKIHSDGLGNVTIDKHANVGPVINKPKIKDSTVIIKKDNR